MVGLVQFLPVILLVPLTGMIADRLSRIRIVQITLAMFVVASAALALISAMQADYRWMYVCLLATGMARAFQQPAKASLLPQLVPIEHFSNAVTWNTSGFQLASVLGPALGGYLIAMLRIDFWFGHQAYVWPVYIADACTGICFLICLTFVRLRKTSRKPRPMSFSEPIEGLRYLGRNRIVLGSILLDMFAVLLGGAVTLLPVYATDVLHAGPAGFGWMRAAPAIGALCVAMLLAHRPPFRRAGRALLWSVAAFGVATIVFGVSRNFWISLTALFLIGAFDNISVVIRHTLVQVLTPDAMRGRVSAINGMFIAMSNELGDIEAGVVAKLLGPVFSVVSGGIGTIVVAIVAAVIWPDLRRYGKLGDGGDD
jgi:MFS family permease